MIVECTVVTVQYAVVGKDIVKTKDIVNNNPL